MNRASSPRRSARIGADRRAGGLDGCRTALGMLVARYPPAIQVLPPAQRETSVVSEIHQHRRLWGRARVPRAALTLQMAPNQL